MEQIRIESTEVSPEVIFDIEKNNFLIKGKSVVTEVDSFYAPLIEWLENAHEKFINRVDFVFDLEYFNIFSSKRILFILYKLNSLAKKNDNVIIKWNYLVGEDEMYDFGQDFALMVNIPFQFIAIEPHIEVLV